MSIIYTVVEHQNTDVVRTTDRRSLQKLIHPFGLIRVILLNKEGCNLSSMAKFGNWQSDNPFPSLQTSVAFLGAFGVAQIMLVSVFDKTRGRTWWGAPLISMIWASTFYVLIFHVVANWGLDREWMPAMAMDFSIKVVAAILLLIPYQMLRRTVKPLPGYGGA